MQLPPHKVDALLKATTDDREIPHEYNPADIMLCRVPFG